MKRSLPLDGCCPVAQSLTAAHEQGEPARETHKPSPKAKPQRAKPSAKRNAKPS